MSNNSNVKHLVVRTDIRKKLRNTRIVLVDSNIFVSELDNTTIDELIDKLVTRDLEHIISRNVKLMLYNRNNNGNQLHEYRNRHVVYKNLNGMVLKDFVNELCISKNVSASNIVLINSMECDTDILSRVGFSVSTTDAPLPVKSNSYYISNMSGTSAFNEVIDLILKSKR